jgi:hypothetical protein
MVFREILSIFFRSSLLSLKVRAVGQGVEISDFEFSNTLSVWPDVCLEFPSAIPEICGLYHLVVNDAAGTNMLSI